MPRPRAAMRNIREVLRLHEAQHLSARAVGIAAGLPRTTVRDYLDRARNAGLSRPLPDGLDDRELEERLFGPRPAPAQAVMRRCLTGQTSIASSAGPTSRSCCCGPYADIGIRSTMPSA